MTLRVVTAGAFTTVQDLGRPGYGAIGVPPSGAMDPYALRAANRLVGNADGAAGLELTMSGPEVALEADHVLSLVAGGFEAELDGNPVASGVAFRAHAGQTIRIGRARAGLRGYLAVRGGIDVPLVLGSRSTLVAAGLGGFGGRPLAPGVVLPVGRADPSAPLRRLRPGVLPYHASERLLRVIAGPQVDAFTARGRERFFAEAWRVSPRSDRAGVRLEGEPVELAGAADLDPEGVVTGAVQVPGDGMPIVLGPDRPATGGYVKIATVIAADLGLVAQARPGDTLRFALCTLERGRVSIRRREDALNEGLEEPA